MTAEPSLLSRNTQAVQSELNVVRRRQTLRAWTWAMIAMLAWPWGVVFSAWESLAELAPSLERSAPSEGNLGARRLGHHGERSPNAEPVLSQMTVEEEDDGDAGLLAVPVLLSKIAYHVTVADARPVPSVGLTCSLPVARLCRLRC
jgi:hypothetical protein